MGKGVTQMGMSKGKVVGTQKTLQMINQSHIPARLQMLALLSLDVNNETIEVDTPLLHVDVALEKELVERFFGTGPATTGVAEAQSKKQAEDNMNKMYSIYTAFK